MNLVLLHCCYVSAVRSQIGCSGNVYQFGNKGLPVAGAVHSFRNCRGLALAGIGDVPTQQGDI